MSKPYVINVMAANRVGILAALTTALDELGADINDVRQTVMGRFLTIILEAEFPEHRESHVIVDHIRDVCRPFAIEVNLKDATLVQYQQALNETESMYLLTIRGEDRPGTLRRIAGLLAQLAIEIRELRASRQDAGCSFVTVMKLAVPSEVDVLTLQSDLKKLGSTDGLFGTLEWEEIGPTEFEFLGSRDPVTELPR